MRPPRDLLVDVALYAVMALGSGYGLTVIKNALTAWSPAESIVPELDAFLLFVAGTSVYLVSIVAWTAILGREKFSFAMPATIALSVVSTALIAAHQLGESLTPVKIGGMAAVILGLVLIARKDPTGRRHSDAAR